MIKEEFSMSIFTKKERIFLNSEEQKENMIEKLEREHISYKLRTDDDRVFSGKPSYIIFVSAKDISKVV